jgi:uncharacterized membrane protein YozB (DUF420 family)
MDMMIILGIGLGHPRFLHIDLNLLIQIITLIIILVSLFYKKKGKIKLHGTTMGIAIVLHVLSFVLVMGPSLYQSFEFFASETGILGVQTTWLHAVPGAIALLLGIFLVAKWAIQPSNVNACYKRKRIMDVTLVLWLVSLAFGIATYVLFYL